MGGDEGDLPYEDIAREAIRRIKKNGEDGKGCRLSMLEVHCLCGTIFSEDDCISEKYESPFY